MSVLVTILSWILPVLLPDMDPTNNLDDLELAIIESDIKDISRPTRVEYVNIEANSALVFEYAQV
jgi:hypothetical protein